MPVPEPAEPVPSLPPVIALPEAENGKSEDLDMAKQLGSAFQAIGDADQGVQKYKGSKSLKVLNATGTHRPPPLLLLVSCSRAELMWRVQAL